MVAARDDLRSWISTRTCSEAAGEPSVLRRRQQLGGLDHRVAVECVVRTIWISTCFCGSRAAGGAAPDASRLVAASALANPQLSGGASGSWITEWRWNAPSRTIWISTCFCGPRAAGGAAPHASRSVAASAWPRSALRRRQQLGVADPRMAVVRVIFGRLDLDVLWHLARPVTRRGTCGARALDASRSVVASAPPDPLSSRAGPGVRGRGSRSGGGTRRPGPPGPGRPFAPPRAG